MKWRHENGGQGRVSELSWDRSEPRPTAPGRRRPSQRCFAQQAAHEQLPRPAKLYWSSSLAETAKEETYRRWRTGQRPQPMQQGWQEGSISPWLLSFCYCYFLLLKCAIERRVAVAVLTSPDVDLAAAVAKRERIGRAWRREQAAGQRQPPLGLSRLAEAIQDAVRSSIQS